MWPLGSASGGLAAIPAGDRRIPAGGGWGSELGPTRVRFGGSIVGEELPEGGHAGGRRRWPPWLPVRRGGGSAGLENGVASYGRSRGGGERAALARGRPGNWSSPRLPGLGAGGRHRTAEPVLGLSQGEVEDRRRVTSSGRRLKAASPSPPAGRHGTGGYGVAGAVPRARYPATRGASPRDAGPSGRCVLRKRLHLGKVRGQLGCRGVPLVRGGAACARERVRGRFLFGVPLFEHVKLQNFVQKCTKQ
jgi:hypothetical protein